MPSVAEVKHVEEVDGQLAQVDVSGSRHFRVGTREVRFVPSGLERRVRAGEVDGLEKNSDIGIDHT